MSTFLLSFHGVLDDELVATLEASGITKMGASGGSSVSTGGKLPAPDRGIFEVEAASEDDAKAKLYAALDDKQISHLSTTPVKSP